MDSFTLLEFVNYITPIVYGSYSFEVKRIVDKFSLIVDAHYYYRDGELVSSKDTGNKYYVIGVHAGSDTEEIKVY